MNRHGPVILLLLSALAGCQSYRTLPLDDHAHHHKWINRSIDDARVREYAVQLAALNADADLAYDLTDGLSLSEAELVALVFNPDLRVARLNAKVPLFGASHAGHWDDPELNFDLLRVTESVKDPWVIGSSLSFTIPISGRLEVEKDKAFAEANGELMKALLAEWTMLGELRIAWTHWSAAVQRITLVETYLEQLDEVIGVAEAQRQANRIGSPELRVLQLEKATRIGELHSFRVEEQRRRLAIKALLGLHPDAPIDLRPEFPLALPELNEADRITQLREHNLRLAVSRAAYEVADEAFRLEIRKQYPDLVIGPGYENEEGMSRAGVVLSIPIPLLNQNRRGIAEARAARDAAKAAYEAEYERIVAELSQAELDVMAAKERSTYIEGTVARMVDEQLADLRRLAELGDLDVLVILDALSRTLETKFQILEARVEEAEAVTRLRSLLRPLNTPMREGVGDEKE